MPSLIPQWSTTSGFSWTNSRKLWHTFEKDWNVFFRKSQLLLLIVRKGGCPYSPIFIQLRLINIHLNGIVVTRLYSLLSSFGYGLLGLCLLLGRRNPWPSNTALTPLTLTQGLLTLCNWVIRVNSSVFGLSLLCSGFPLRSIKCTQDPLHQIHI